eukprot:COSAG06_NODE_50160_length_320_cov_1.167421_1_plen_32_part_10
MAQKICVFPYLLFDAIDRLAVLNHKRDPLPAL